MTLSIQRTKIHGPQTFEGQKYNDLTLAFRGQKSNDIKHLEDKNLTLNLCSKHCKATVTS